MKKLFEFKSINNNIIKLFPSYVGSKAYWIPYLPFLKNEYIVELFCGSSVISVNLASRAILNDLDPYIYKILSCYKDLEVSEIFTQEDYFKVRNQEDWWKYIYCLQKMSFSGVFRYSKNGFNVPVKKDIQEIHVLEEYLKAKERLKRLDPLITNLPYNEVVIPDIEQANVILDPPYENAQASYNKSFDYHLYWEFVNQLEKRCKRVIVFDSIRNMPIVRACRRRKMRVNGKMRGGDEAMQVFDFDEQLNVGQKGEAIFYELFKPQVNRLTGLVSDFEFKKNKKTIELKSDNYRMNVTKNFFMERYSKAQDKSPGGPWQALGKSDFFYYFFLRDGIIFKFKTKELIEKLEEITKNWSLVDVGNTSGEGWITQGYKVPRDMLKDIYNEHVIEDFNKKMKHLKYAL